MEDKGREGYLNINKKRWNELVTHHMNNSTYDVAGFRKGKSQLNNLDLELLGDLQGKKILHLQCHFGMDTMSLLYEGAEEVVGVDFSSEAVRAASQLAEELQLNARFIESDVLKIHEVFDEFGSFDIVFTSYGTIVWLPDLTVWGQNINKYLKPNGVFLIIDAHPFSHIFDDTSEEKVLRPIYRYFHEDKPDLFKVEGSYATSEKIVNHDEYIWVHPVSTIINSISSHGLKIERFEEYSQVNWQMYPFLEKQMDGWYRFPKDWNGPIIPLLFAIKARKTL